MAVAHDAITESATWTTTNPHTFDHTPSGTPRGVLVFIGHDTSSVLIDGIVSYGGVAMRLVGTEADTSGEAARVSIFFLGSGIPTGTQTVSISHTGSASVKWGACATVTASADTEIGSFVSSQQAYTNATLQPQLSKGEKSGLAYFIGYNGAALTNLTLAANCTDLNVEHEISGTRCWRIDRETNPSSGLTNVGYSQSTTDDHAIVAVNVQEVGSGAYIQGARPTLSTSSSTVNAWMMGGDLDGKDLYVFVGSRDSTSASSDVTCTDDSGVGSWVRVNNDTDKKMWVFWKRGTQADVGATVSLANMVGSSTGGMIWMTGTDGANGNPTTNLTDETNASGNETHAGIDPTDDGAVVVFGVFDYANDTNQVTAISGATMGSLDPEWFERSSTGGSDCRITVTGRTLASGATGNITWTQSNSTTKSVLFAVRPALGLTEIGQEVGLQWNIADLLADQVSFGWVTLDTVGDTSTSRWDTLLTAGDEVESVWHVSLALGDSSSFVWGVSTAMGDNIQSVWNTLRALGDEGAFVWDIAQAIGDEGVLRWDAGAVTGKETQSLWNIEGAFGEELTLRFHTLDTVGDESEAVWHSLNLAGDAALFVWDVRLALGDTMTARWETFTALGGAVQALWHTLDSAGKLLGLSWHTLGSANIHTGLIWSIASLLGDVTQVIWSTFSLLTDSIEPVWNVDSSVGDALQTRWGVGGRVSDLVALTWNALEAISDESALSWDIMETIGDESDLLWSERSNIGDITVIRWDVSGPFGKPISIAWNTLVPTGDANQIAWEILEVLGEQIQLPWNASSVVGDSGTMRWDTFDSVEDRTQFIWNVLIPVGNQLSHNWNINALVADTLDSYWGIMAILGDATTSVWHVLVPVTDEVEAIWDITLSIGDTSTFAWDVIGRAADSIYLVWFSVYHYPQLKARGQALAASYSKTARKPNIGRGRGNHLLTGKGKGHPSSII